MKAYFLHIILLAFTVLTLGCIPEDGKKKTDTQEGQDTATLFASFDSTFQKVMLQDDGVFRGHYIGDTYDQVMHVENNIPLVERKADYLIYDISANNRRASIKFTFSEGQLNEIYAKIELLSKEEYERVLKELEQFYTVKFGKPEITPEQNEIWRVKNADTHEIDIIHQPSERIYTIIVDVK